MIKLLLLLLWCDHVHTELIQPQGKGELKTTLLSSCTTNSFTANARGCAFIWTQSQNDNIETSKSLSSTGNRGQEKAVGCPGSFSPAQGYFQVVERRNRPSLLPIIQRCLLPRSVVHTDDWAEYHRLDPFLPNVAQHEVIVHGRNFVDHNTGVHTQNIESAQSTSRYQAA